MSESSFSKPTLTESQIRELFSLSTQDDITAFLRSIDSLSQDRWQWVPLGGRQNNAGSVNLAVESGQALVERITNSLDAQIELRYELSGHPSNLHSPRSAVTRLWGLEAERLSRQSHEMVQFISKMAPKTVVRVAGSPKRRQSTVTVEDRGIGQNPREFHKTLLSLGESNKIDKPYLMGAFGQGGSSTFAYCPYSVIVSRRDLGCLDGNSDLVGWTIVRKYDDDSLKVFRYEYLVDVSGNIPTIDPTYLNSIELPFYSGTRFVHIAYDLGRLNSRWSIVGYRYFDNLLFDPVLPYRIEDHRFKRPFNRNLYGARNRLDQVDPARRPEAQNYDADLAQWDGEGRVRIRYWVFRPEATSSSDPDDVGGVKLDSYLDYSNSPRTISFTLNGQRHHSQEKRIVRGQRLGALADYLLMHVDCDGMSRRLKKEIFTATRTGATSGEQREDLLLRAVRDALSDSWLRQKLNEIVRRRQDQIADESTRRVQRILDKLISVHRLEQKAGGQRGKNKGGSGRRGDEKRQFQDPPSFLRFADHNLLEVQRGDSVTVFLLTDGPDDLLDRRRRRARVSVECEGEAIASFAIGSMRNGRIPIQVRVPSETPAGRRQRMMASLEMTPMTYLTDNRDLRVVPPPDPYMGVDPPTIFSFASDSPIAIETGRQARAEIRTDARNDILERPINPASIETSCDVTGVSVAVRGPRDGTARAEARASIDAIPGTEGLIRATLSFDNGDHLHTSRPCKVAAARPRPPHPGHQNAPVPAYHVVRVWRDPPDSDSESTTWDTFPNPWDETKVGTWEMNEDELYLYVNMDERRFRAERHRHVRGKHDARHIERIIDRYVAYLSFHLFQLHEQSQRVAENSDNNTNASSNADTVDIAEGYINEPESTVISDELQRVAATILQTLRSEAELLQLEATTMDQD